MLAAVRSVVDDVDVAFRSHSNRLDRSAPRWPAFGAGQEALLFAAGSAIQKFAERDPDEPGVLSAPEQHGPMDVYAMVRRVSP